MSSPQRYIWLDLVRGLSAVAVCAGHLRAAMFVDYAQLHEPSLGVRAFYFVTGLGHQAVMVFFVLSGFLVGGSVLANRDKFKLADYMIARLTRLWVVLIPALLVTFLVDEFLAAHHPAVLSGAYASLWNSGPPADGAYSRSLVTLLGNVFFLQTIATPVFGTNGPLWSLANEFWYYLLFPLCLFPFGYGSGQGGRRFIGLFAIPIFFILPQGMRLGYLVWLLGAGLYFVSNRLEAWHKPFMVIGTFTFIGSLMYSKVGLLQVSTGLSSDLVVGLGFFVFCAALICIPQSQNTKSPLFSCARGLSEISYSLYLVHFPFVVVIGSLLYGSRQIEPSLMGFGQYFGWLAFLLSLGAAFWWAFERNTNAIRKLVSRRLVPVRVAHVEATT